MGGERERERERERKKERKCVCVCVREREVDGYIGHLPQTKTQKSARY